MKCNSKFVALFWVLLLGCFESSIPVEKEANEVVESDCDRAKKEAENDYKNNELGLYFYGLPNSRLNHWVRLMRQEYNLKIKGGGDIIEEKGDCYNQAMIKKIKDKFGGDAFERIDTKLDSLYLLGIGDAEPKFPGGQAKLMEYIYCNMEDELFAHGKDIPIVIFQILIMKNGAIENKGIVFQNGFAKKDNKYEKKTVQIAAQMPNWTPSIRNGIKVNSEYYIPIIFKEKMKIDYCK